MTLGSLSGYWESKMATSPNTAYTLRANALDPREIAFGNFVYAGNVVRNLNSQKI